MSYHRPPGVKRGVRRGVGKGYLLYNGHPHVSEDTAQAVLDYLKRMDRPVTSMEVADSLKYSRVTMRAAMRYMDCDGLIVRLAGSKGSVNVYDLPRPPTPGDEVEAGKKECARCHRVFSLDSFHRDSRQASGRHSRCRWCRSPRANKQAVTVYSPKLAAH